MTRIKICGLSEVEPTSLAAEAGADFLGMVFASSRRQVAVEQAAAIAGTVHGISIGNRPALVGVFVNARVEEVNRLADSCRLDWVQLSGDESWDYCQQVNHPVIKVIHLTENQQVNDILAVVEEGYRLLLEKDLICLLDSRVGIAYGGTGKTFNWQMAEEVAARFPVMVAGGLTPANVGQLVEQVRPWGVDVSSGVEIGGRKDSARIKAFIEAVKAADSRASDTRG